jgi:uncharacterized membrane protein
MIQKLVNILLVEDDEVDVNVKEHSQNNIKDDLYIVAGNGVEALEMLRDLLFLCQEYHIGY